MLATADSVPHDQASALEPSAQNFCLIPLTRGYAALVDPEDFDIFGRLKWCAAVQTIKGFRVYAKRGVNENGRVRTIFLHREIAGPAKGQSVDHINRNTLDCRRSNLRICTQQQNRFNVVRPTVSKHGFVGVDSQTDGSYRGRVGVSRRTYWTKTFPTPLQAAVARDVLVRQLHGEFAVTNFPAMKGELVCQSTSQPVL